MNKARIYQLVKAVPPQIALYAPALSNPDARALSSQRIERLARAETDPAFPWAYASAYAAARAPLPALVDEPSIHLAYRYLTTCECGEALTGALVLRQESKRLQRGLLEALLLVSPALPLERIVELTGLTVGVVQIFEQLFFSVRDRTDDQMFILGLVYPRTRVVEFEKDYAEKVDPCDLLKRAAHRGGVEVVMDLVGALASGTKPSQKELIRILHTDIMAEAGWLAKAGLIHQDLLIFRRAMKLIVTDIKATARAQATGWIVGAGSAVTRQPAPGWSLLDNVKTTLASDRAKARTAKTKLAKSVITSSQSSQSSCESQPPIACPERQPTIWIGPAHRVRPADPELLPKGNRDPLQENLLGIRNRSSRPAELPVIIE